MRRLLNLLSVLIVLAPVGARAQGVTLSFSNLQSNTQNPTLADYESGYLVDATAATWTLSVSGSRTNCAYSSRMQIRATTASLGSGKAISDVEWRLNSGSWNSLTTTFADVVTAPLSRSNTSDNGTLSFRIRLDWGDDAASYTSAQLQFQVIVTPSGTNC